MPPVDGNDRDTKNQYYLLAGYLDRNGLQSPGGLSARPIWTNSLY